jgi:hypothetical protein
MAQRNKSISQQHESECAGLPQHPHPRKEMIDHDRHSNPSDSSTNTRCRKALRFQVAPSIWIAEKCPPGQELCLVPARLKTVSIIRLLRLLCLLRQHLESRAVGQVQLARPSQSIFDWRRLPYDCPAESELALLLPVRVAKVRSEMLVQESMVGLMRRRVKRSN